MWGRARVVFRISSEEFWQLTPKQYHYLYEWHLEDLLHQEMCSGLTTAAVVNGGFYRPEKPVVVLDYMPSHPYRNNPQSKPATPEQQAQMDDYMAKVMQLSAELKDYAESGNRGAVMSELQSTE